MLFFVSTVVYSVSIIPVNHPISYNVSFSDKPERICRFENKTNHREESTILIE